MLLALSSVVLTGCEEAKLVTDEYPPWELQYVHNKHRCEHDLEQLMLDPALNEFAQKHAEWMCRKRSMTHSDINVQGFGYRGENIAMGQRDVDVVTEAWMNSPGHRRNILNKNYTHVGFGYARYPDGRPYWCTVLGKPSKPMVLVTY